MTRMMLLRVCWTAPLFYAVATAADPLSTAWIMSPVTSPGPSRLLPEVHAVSVDERYVTVRSGGISLRYFGPLQPSPRPTGNLREFVFRIPLHPEPETGRHARVPIEVIGAFVNGLPIYNQFEALSWNGANLWHYDAVAYNDDGTLTAAGRPRAELTHPAAAGLLDQLAQDGSRHSPLIGFALDGYPIYGPWAYENPDGSGGMRKMRSSYQPRSITRRHEWLDGTRLTPEQYGPDVSAANPPGTFAEDYEYVRGSGDLDEFNGRWSKTPEYPEGTYAYFLSTDAAGRLAFPYLIGPRFYGRITAAASERSFRIGSKRLELSAGEPHIESGHPVRLRLEARNAAGEPIRNLEYVHERPIHVLIVSADLAEFDHIHPELAADDSYQVTHTFAHGGRYRIWADYALPGEEPRIDEFDVDVRGPSRTLQKLTASRSLSVADGSFGVTLTPSKPLRAGDDIPITLRLTGSTGELEPYLGAWAHVIVAREDLRNFMHAHAMAVAGATGCEHTQSAAGAPPGEIKISVNFPSSGLYKLWAQFQRSGNVVTVPFVLRVGRSSVSSRF